MKNDESTLYFHYSHSKLQHYPAYPVFRKVKSINPNRFNKALSERLVELRYAIYGHEMV